MYFIRPFHVYSEEVIAEILIKMIGDEDSYLFSYNLEYLKFAEDDTKQYIMDRKIVVNEDWVYPSSLFPKPDGDIDFRTLWYEVRTIEEIAHSIRLNALFTALIWKRNTPFEQYSYVLHAFEDLDAHVLGIYEHHNANFMEDVLPRIESLNLDIEFTGEDSLNW